MNQLVLRPMPGTYAVCRLDARCAIPDWAGSSEFLCLTRTADELSIVCAQSVVPANVQHEPGWRCFQLEGPIPFTEVGVLASLLQPLAQVKIGVFAISTYDTDYVLVKECDEMKAREEWLAAGCNLPTA